MHETKVELIAYRVIYFSRFLGFCAIFSKKRNRSAYIHSFSHSLYMYLFIIISVFIHTYQIQDQLLATAQVHMVVYVSVEGNDYLLEARSSLVLILCRIMSCNLSIVATVFSQLTLYVRGSSFRNNQFSKFKEHSKI